MNISCGHKQWKDKILKAAMGIRGRRKMHLKAKCIKASLTPGDPSVVGLTLGYI